MASSRLQEIVAARLRTLDADQMAIVEILALGEPVPATFLETLFPPTTLEAAERGGIAVVERSGRRVVARLAHPLYGEVVRVRCPVLRARALHHQLATALAARLRRMAANVEGPLPAAYSAHVDALVSGDGRRLDQVATSFEVIGADLLAAEAAAEAAGAHRAAGRKASMLASNARAGRLLAACEGARTPSLSAVAMPLLTPREREVVSLLAAGLTPSEIARRFVLSVRTVENHVQNSYGKLGVSSRQELRSVLLGPEEAA